MIIQPIKMTKHFTLLLLLFFNLLFGFGKTTISGEALAFDNPIKNLEIKFQNDNFIVFNKPNGLLTHPFPEMCAETQRLTQTFMALANGWSQLGKDNPDVYKQVLLHGVLPSSKKAVDISGKSATNRRKFFAEAGLEYTDDGDIFYVDGDSVVQFRNLTMSAGARVLAVQVRRRSRNPHGNP